MIEPNGKRESENSMLLTQLDNDDDDDNYDIYPVTSYANFIQPLSNIMTKIYVLKKFKKQLNSDG